LHDPVWHAGRVITVATPAERARILQTLVAAFAADPEVRYFFPEEAGYPAAAQAFFGYLFDKRVDQRTIWTVGGGVSVAMWEPPSLSSATLAERSELLLPEPAASRVHDFETAVAATVPNEPFWYLGVLGTDPEHLGNGYGRAVMRMGLERAAAEGLPAYLETTTAANVAMYRRAGWEVTAELTEPLPTWVMRWTAPGSGPL
jgi:GNAT superfamily N-acetyltransferase